MVLTPLDLEDLEYTGFAINSGRFTDVDQTSALLTDQFGSDGDAFSAALGDNGFVNAYSLELDQPAVIGDPTQGLTQVVTSTILEFESDSSARAAFEELATTDIVPGSTDVSTDIGSGFAVQGNISPSAGFAVVEGVVAIRVTDERIAILVVVPETDASIVTPLIDRLLKKVDTVTRDGCSELGLQTLRLTEPSVALDRGFYSIAGGGALRVVTQVNEEFERFQERYEGAINGYQQVQVVTSSDGTRLQIRTFLAEFANDAAASAWLGDAMERQVQLANPEMIVVDDDFAEKGYESVSLTYSLSGGNGVQQGSFRDASLRSSTARLMHDARRRRHNLPGDRYGTWCRLHDSIPDHG